jgi:hypothetical protein
MPGADSQAEYFVREMRASKVTPSPDRRQNCDEQSYARPAHSRRDRKLGTCAVEAPV